MFSKKNNTFIIAELSANHGGKLEIAKETVRAAKRAGADAIKLQTYTADTITINGKQDHFKITQGTHWDGQYLYDLYKEAYLPWEWHKELFETAKEESLICFSSPFDFSAVDFLETLNCPIYKIASFEITDVPLIEYTAKKGKPMIISTGIATIEDIELAIDTCKNVGNNDITILKCTSAYPAEPEDAHLLTIPDIISRFNVKSGLSDHTLGIEAPVVSVCVGGSVIEKHFILDKTIGGADAHFSLDEEEFAAMVKAVRTAEKVLGKVDYELSSKKKKSREFCRSLFIVKDVKEGEVLTKENVRSIRPGFGIHPKYYYEIMGKKFNEDLKKGTPLDFKFIN
ncbi:pseudaminic acid synthase [Maribacter sp. 4U21]|uniref:pseudaminic acid synthase n=1 Tax=Maribacter sp. 4U21 TaxID=1889779 RepID=UPI000C15D02F|nr:pseudaminic acid synthase [Maribacter sp. 4U21]PIB28698.1 pseudaminic acid synthase [Maribacter sp. 4U21]